jgi:hypothetical protein
MAGMRSDPARVRARHLLAALRPVPDDAEFYRLREPALDYIGEAERLDVESRADSGEPEELISAALDAVARDYFSRALGRKATPKKR